MEYGCFNPFCLEMVKCSHTAILVIEDDAHLRETLAWILEKVEAGLDHAHRRGILHRDI